MKKTQSKNFPIETITYNQQSRFQEVYDGSYYTITGACGDLQDWINGYTDMLTKHGIGTPKKWVTFSGRDVNAVYKLNNENVFANDVVFLAFPLDGLDVGKLALFKIREGDCWFDDIVDNCVDASPCGGET